MQRVNFFFCLLRNDGKEGWRGKRKTQRTTEIEMILTASVPRNYIYSWPSLRYLDISEVNSQFFKKKHNLDDIDFVSIPRNW